jgi:ATP-dependent Clp protease ATP-binding subunit ClpB
MDRLWANCECLAGSTTTTYSNADQRLPAPSSFVKPLHLALGFLFDGLREPSDPRLHTDKSELPRSLELPLFWTAISRASRRGDFVSHLQEMTNRLLDERLIQQRIGQDIWQKLQETNQRDERTSSGAEVSREHENRSNIIF